MGGGGNNRRDAQRNRRLVIAAGVELLARDPEMRIQDIADASGLGRTTIYRHFPNRDLLLEAVLAEVMASARNVVAAAAVDPSDPVAAIASLSEALLAVGFEYGKLIASRDGESEAFEQAKEAADSPTRIFLTEARELGTIRTDVSLQWQRSLMQAVPLAAIDEVEAGAITRQEARRLVAGTLTSVLLPR
jgi:AcrR family transcriptional regulator